MPWMSVEKTNELHIIDIHELKYSKWHELWINYYSWL